MKQIIKQASLIIGLLSGVAILAIAPIGLAHNDSDDSGNTNSGRGSDNTTLAVETDDSTAPEDRTIATTSDDKGSLRSRAKALLQDKREKAKEHTKSQRQNACEGRKNSILKRTKAYAAAAERHLETFDKISTRVQAFYTDKQLQVANYDELLATVTTKQVAAQDAVDALKAFNIEIDCTQDDPATTVADVKTAVSDARTALKEYRTSLKDLVVALKGASTSTNNTTEQEEGTN